MNNDLLLQIYRRPETVFTVSEIAQLCPQISYESLRDRLYYFTKVRKIIHVHKGIYAKQQYSVLELANKIYTPSYISLETVLIKGGVVFQHYETIFLVSYVTRNIGIDNIDIQYRQLKASILTNAKGIEQKDGYFIASLERAFLDAVYIYKNYHFDNLGTISWKKVKNLMGIYRSNVFEKRVAEYYKVQREEYGKQRSV